MRVLITGGAGFIGSHLAKKIEYEMQDVRVLDNLSSGSREKLSDKIEFVKGDVRSVDDCDEAVRNVDVVVHMAALISVKDSYTYPSLYHDNNVTGTLNMILASEKEKVKKFVFISSAACYDPSSFYAVTKVTGEHYCSVSGLDAICLRLFNVYGIGQKSDYAGVITKFLEFDRNKENPVIYGDGRQTRDFVYVDDIAKAIWQSCNDVYDDNIYDVGTGVSVSILELAQKICSMQPIMKDGIKGEVRFSRANNILPRFKSETTLDRGLLKIMENNGQKI